VAAVFVAVAASVGGYVGVRSFVGENADAVSVLVTGLIDSGPAQPIPTVHEDYSGALARQLQMTFNTYRDPGFDSSKTSGAFVECTPNHLDRKYMYSLTFTLKGVIVEAVLAHSYDCSWAANILGVPAGKSDFAHKLASALSKVVGGVIPT
jgi:hypothetical protein